MEATERQRRIFYFIAHHFYRFGVTPGIREIGAAVGLGRSTASVKYQVNQLVEGGLIDRVPGRAHGLSLHGSRQCPVPLVGRIAAGAPLRLAETDFSLTDHELVFVPADMASPESGFFALEVRGMSMIDALVNDGDIVILRRQEDAENGEMVAAWLIEEGETTLKYLHRELDRGRVRLQPANPHMAPLYVRPSNLRIDGKVVGVIRKL